MPVARGNALLKMTNRAREIKAGVTAENQFPYLLTIDQVR